MCKHLVEDCPIVIEGRKPPAILVVFKMLGFDVILGLDWLSKHYASIDCQEKVVTFRPPGDVEFCFDGAECRLLCRFFQQFRRRSVSRMASMLSWLVSSSGLTKK